MTATAWQVAATTTVEGNTPETLARRLRAHLQALAALRLPIIYQEAAKALPLLYQRPEVVTPAKGVSLTTSAVIRSVGWNGGGYGGCRDHTI